MIAYIEEYNLSQAKNNIIKHAQLDWSDQSEPFSTQFDDVYFNNSQGQNESQYVFFEGNSLDQRWNEFAYQQFCIIETGFGSGLNFINTAKHFISFTQTNKNENLRRLHFISFEQYPLSVEDLKRTLQNFPQFKSLTEALISQYPMPLIGCHRLTFNAGKIILDLWFGDINEQIDNLSHHGNGIADAWFLDGFNPSHNPEMWHLTLFEKMFKLSKPKATLATFTAAGFVRRSLTQAGFNIKKRKGYGKKREMLVGDVNSETASKGTSEIDNIKFNHLIDVAIIGGGIAALCSALALAKRGNQVTIYCAESELGSGASGNLQGALYPLLNQQHDALSQLFANAYLYALNFYQTLNQQHAFSHQFNGLIQLAYDPSSSNKLQKINNANLPTQLLHWVDAKTTNQLAGVSIDHPALYYPTGGWLSPRQLITSLTNCLNEFDNVTICCHHHIKSFLYDENSNNLSDPDNAHHSGGNNNSKKWLLQREIKHPISDISDNQPLRHNTLIIAAGFDTLKFEQCRAVPLSAARGQVSHIKTTPELSSLKRTLCHEGYLTPSIDNEHCMGATFKRHDQDISYRETEQIDNHQKLKKCVTNKPWVESITTNDQAHIAIRCTTRDHFPYVGELTDYDQLKKGQQLGLNTNKTLKTLPDVYLLTGLGSRGLCSAPLLGEILASKINQESLPIDKHIDQKMRIPRQWISYMLKNKPLKD